MGKIIGLYKMARHFELDITEDGFAYRRKQSAIAEEAALDGLYVIRTSLPRATFNAEGVVLDYKGWSRVERAFPSFETADLKVRPIHHYRPERVRAHVFLSLLAYHAHPAATACP